MFLVNFSYNFSFAAVQDSTAEGKQQWQWLGSNGHGEIGSDHFIDFPVNQMYRPVGELRQSFIMGYDNKRLSETVT